MGNSKETCVAPGCLYSIQITNLKYYSIPYDPERREQWLMLLGRTDLISKPNQCYIVCSMHFDATVKAINLGNSVKKIAQVPTGTPKACRVCLAMDGKMFNTTEYNLETKLQFIIGISADKVKLPQHICWECTAKLNAAILFRNKALLSVALMQSHLKTQERITYQDLKIMREQNKSLRSRLVVQNVLTAQDLGFNETKVTKDPHEEKYVKVQKALEVQNEKVIGVNNEEEEIEYPIEDFECLDEYTHLLKDPIKEENDLEIKEEFENIDTFLNPTSGIDVEDGLFDDDELYFIEVTEENTNNTEVTDDEVIFEETNENTEFLIGSEDDNSNYHKNNPNEEVVIKNNTVKNKPFKNKMPQIKNSKKKIRQIKNSKKKIRQIKNSEKKIPQIKNFEKKMTDVRNSCNPHSYRLGLPNIVVDKEFTITPLNPEMIKKDKEDRRNSLKYKMAKFKCTECYNVFCTAGTLKRHLFKHSMQGGPYTCDICKVHYKKKRRLRNHIIDSHMNLLTCNRCAFTTKRRNAAYQHLQTHSGPKFKCPNCPMVLQTFSGYMGHLRIKHISDFVCNLCGFTFVSKRGILVHRNLKHQDVSKNVKLNGPYCQECDVTFISEEAYDRHLKVSSKHLTSEMDPIRIRNEIKYSNRSFQEPKKLADQSPVLCQECGKKFDNYRCYTIHFGHKHRELVQARLLTTTNYICDQCGRAFASKAILRQHSWIHTGKQHKCNQCNKLFATKHRLDMHKRTHEDNVKTYKCTLCGKEFLWANNIKRHMLLHSEGMQFSCDFCGKSFKQSDGLKSHVRHIHLNVPWPKKKKREKKKEMDHED